VSGILITYLLLKIVRPKIKASTKSTMNIPNSILPTEAAPSAMPVNPKIAATIAIRKKTADHLSMR